MRICKRCAISKEETCFAKGRNVCKTCSYLAHKADVIAWQSLHADRNREIKKLSQRKFRQTHKEEIKAYKSKRRSAKAGNNGSHTAKEWLELKLKYNNTCLRCGCTDCEITKDHVIPVKLGGTDYITNIQPLCRSCNSSKKATHTDYREITI